MSVLKTFRRKLLLIGVVVQEEEEMVREGCCFCALLLGFLETPG